jgi:hypothetical protein
VAIDGLDFCPTFAFRCRIERENARTLRRYLASSA